MSAIVLKSLPLFHTKYGVIWCNSCCRQPPAYFVKLVFILFYFIETIIHSGWQLCPTHSSCSVPSNQSPPLPLEPFKEVSSSGQNRNPFPRRRSSDADMDGFTRTENSSPLSSNQSFLDSIIVALRIIDVVIFLSHFLRINFHQCKRLVDFYRRARLYFDELKRSGVFVQEQLYDDAVDALDKGLCLINGYIEANWQKSIKNTGVNEDAFAKIYVKLEDSFRAICENIEAGVSKNHYTHHKKLYLLLEFDTLAPLYFLNEDYRATLFKRDAQMDKKHMLEIIQNKYTIKKIESTTITTNRLRAGLDREQGLLAEALLKNKEAKVVLIKRLVDEELEEKKEAEERLNEKEMLVVAEILRREEVEQELLKLELLLLPKEFELRQHEKKKLPPSGKESSRATHTMFTAALDIIDSVIFLGGHIQINLHQCKRLVDFYKRARQFFNMLKRYAISIEEYLSNNTLAVINEGRDLVYSYVDANWLTSKKTTGVNQDAFARVYVKLEDCFGVIWATLEAVNHHTGSYPPIEFGSLAPLYFLDDDNRATLFQRDAQMDKEHMLEMIKGSSAMEYDKENMIHKIESTNITTQGLKARLERPEQRIYELLKKKQVEQLLKQAVEKEAEKQKQREDLSSKKLQEEKLLRERLEEELLEKKEALDLGREEALAAQEKLQRKRLEKELSKLKLVLEQKEYELAYQQRSKNSTTPKKEELKAAPSASLGTDLLPDFKIQSSEIRIGDKIGSGGFATIHKCQWQNHDYAVKIFKATDMQELRTEVQNLVLLPRHPNIVLLVGFSIRETHGNPMLLMELLDGDLHTLVCTGESAAVETKKKHRLTDTMSRLFGRDVGLSTPTKIDFIYQIAKGMLFMHKRKVFHGDLKAKNVLVKQRPRSRVQLKIADFGVSEKLILERTHRNKRDSDADFDCSTFSNHSSLGLRHISEEGNVQQVVLGNVGTVRWMAPEVYGIPGTTDMKPYSMKADVYSFAMTCVEILTGQHPFPDKGSLKAIKLHVKNGGRPDLSTLKNTFPETLLHLVKSCWDANPSSRPDFSEIYSSMQKLKKAFPIN